MNFHVVFDKTVKDNMMKAIRQSSYKEVIRKWLDALEYKGPKAGKILDNRVWLYELKNKNPPLRLYYHHQKFPEKIIIFELEMKTSEKKQQRTINKLRKKISDT